MSTKNLSHDFIESTNFPRETQFMPTNANTINNSEKGIEKANLTINNFTDVNRNKPWRKIIRRQIVDG